MASTSSQAKNSISRRIKAMKVPKARLSVSLFSASSVWFRSKVIQILPSLPFMWPIVHEMACKHYEAKICLKKIKKKIDGNHSFSPFSRPDTIADMVILFGNNLIQVCHITRLVRISMFCLDQSCAETKQLWISFIFQWFKLYW